jgi:hypothetical protein
MSGMRTKKKKIKIVEKFLGYLPHQLRTKRRKKICQKDKKRKKIITMTNTTIITTSMILTIL